MHSSIKNVIQSLTVLVLLSISFYAQAADLNISENTVVDGEVYAGLTSFSFVVSNVEQGVDLNSTVFFYSAGLLEEGQFSCFLEGYDYLGAGYYKNCDLSYTQINANTYRINGEINDVFPNSAWRMDINILDGAGNNTYEASNNYPIFTINPYIGNVIPISNNSLNDGATYTNITQFSFQLNNAPEDIDTISSLVSFGRSYIQDGGFLEYNRFVECYFSDVPLSTYCELTATRLDANTINITGTVNEPFGSELGFVNGSPWDMSIEVRDAVGNYTDEKRSNTQGFFPGGFNNDDLIKFTIDSNYVGVDTPVVTNPSYQTNNSNYILSGTKQADTYIVINDVQYDGDFSDTQWSQSISLEEGPNAIKVTARDVALIDSLAVSFNVTLDTVMPAISAVNPSAGNAYSSIDVITFELADSLGINKQADNIFYIESAGKVDNCYFVGSANDTETNNCRMSFPGNFVRGVVTVNLQEARGVAANTQGETQLFYRFHDRVGNVLTNIGNGDSEYQYIIDSVAPSVPVVSNEGLTTDDSSITLTGSKEAGSSITINGNEVVALNEATTWSATVDLAIGSNSFNIVSTDAVGNISEPLQIDVTRTVPALPEVPFTLSSNNNTIEVDFYSYYDLEDAEFNPLVTNADVAKFEIYQSTQNFSDLSNAILVTELTATNAYHEWLVEENTTYFVTVVAYNLNNSPSTFAVQQVQTGDALPIPNIDYLDVEPLANSANLSWDSADAIDDYSQVTGFNLYVNDVLREEFTSIAAVSYVLTDLEENTFYDVKVTSVTANGDESTGYIRKVYATLSNPISNITATSEDGKIYLQWTSIIPNDVMGQYKVLAADSVFTSSNDFPPGGQRLDVAATERQKLIDGLQIDTPYYFTVYFYDDQGNVANGFDVIQATPISDDVDGPVINQVLFNDALLSSGNTIIESGTFSIDATDDSGISRAEFKINDQLIATDSYTVDGLKAYWDILPLSNGSYTLDIAVFDTLGRVTETNFDLTVALAVPAAPVISRPVDGVTQAESSIVVSGTLLASDQVQFYLNDVAVGEPVAITQNSFSTQMELAEGTNNIAVAGINRTGEGTKATVQVTVDSSLPVAPTNLTGSASEGGEVTLNWGISDDTNITGYYIYRATQAFDDASTAQQLNNSPINRLNYADLPAADADYVYRIAAVNNLNVVSELSNSITIGIDSTPPSAQIIYNASTNVDAENNRFGVGTVAIELIVSEKLLTTPFLTLTPTGGVPISVNLTKVSDTEYSGSFDITDDVVSANTYAVFSARDVVGNRGTSITEGSSIIIDTDGPAVTDITVNPASPIKNDSAQTVVAEFTLSEAPVSQPVMSYQLSDSQSAAITIDNITDNGNNKWSASFTLPADAGLTSPEILSFAIQAEDDLSNTDNKIIADNAFQVYQGDLPPLAIPSSLQAQAQAGGKVNLNWEEVTSAVSYNLYRQAPGESTLSLLQNVNTTEYVDQTSIDGEYQYAIASVRQANAQETISAQSTAVTVNTDSIAPAAPTGLTLELIGAGIQATWDGETLEDSDGSYSVYRSDDINLSSVEGMQPLQDTIASAAYIDPTPNAAEPVYVVTRSDATGNESAPSQAKYLNEQLFPVASITIDQTETDFPELSWTHSNPSTIASYKLMLGEGASEIQLNQSQITDTSFTDQGYSANERLYTIIAVDTNGMDSLGRSITLPQVTFAPTDDVILKRGVMNRVPFTITNQGSSPITNATLDLTIGSYQNQSVLFSVQAGETKTIDVIVGGYQDLPDILELATTLRIEPNVGENISINRSFDAMATEAGLTATISQNEFTRGGLGQVRFSVQNDSETAIELISALRSGQDPSSDIRFKLTDEEGNVLATQAYQQAVGTGVITLTDKRTVARLAAGETFESAWIDLAIPLSAPDDIFIELEIDNIHYRLGEEDTVTIQGITSRQSASLIDVEYTADITAITPQQSFGNEDIVITGSLTHSSTQLSMNNAPLKLVLVVDGFERIVDLYSDSTGNFSYTFTPLQNESGRYKVSAVHPQIVDRPEQGEFLINRILVSPDNATLNVPYNYDAAGTFQIKTGLDTPATNVRMVLRAQDQSNGELPIGITITPDAPITMAGNQTRNYKVITRADNTALDTGSFVMAVLSDESGDTAMATVAVDYTFTEFGPVLTLGPQQIGTGVARDKAIEESIVLSNKGFSAMENVQLSLLTLSGQLAPSWSTIQTASSLGNVAIGDEKDIVLAFAPTQATAEGITKLKLRITSDNLETTEIPVDVTVSQSGIGSVLFKAADLFTATVDADGEVIQGMEGASIKVINELTLDEATLTTDELGEALFTDLAAGSYRFRASASGYEDLGGSFEMKAGITVTEDIFMNFQLVTVEWSVNEITIRDRYEIIIDATFVTDVPIAVVVVEPGNVNLPDMEPGDVFTGEFRMTNHGLIRAEDIQFELPSDEYFKYELIDGLPTILEAKQSITIPYRLTMLQSLQPDTTGSGGGCINYSQSIGIRHESHCVNGQIVQSSSPFAINHRSGSCPGGTGGGGGAVFRRDAIIDRPNDCRGASPTGDCGG